MDIATANSAMQTTFMDPSAIKDMANNAMLEDDAKVSQIGGEFEKIFIRQMMTDAMKPMFDKNASNDDYSQTFVPELAADALCSDPKNTPLGISHVMQTNLKTTK